jgi:hypothetical protein
MRKGGAALTTWHKPSSGSRNHRPIRSLPSAVGWGREREEGRGSGGVEGSSKWKRGEGKTEAESDTLMEEVVQTHMW